MALTRIYKRLQQANELDVSMFNESFLQLSVEKRIQAAGCESLEDYVVILEQDPGECKNLTGFLLIHYSEFFRDPLTYVLLERTILPGLVQAKKANKQKEIRVWSAGCAAGQEPGSIAILLEEAIDSADSDLHYRIFATDLDETSLKEARLGRYPAEALKNVGLRRVQTWFTHQDGDYVIRPSLQQYIDYSIFDLGKEDGTCPAASIFGDFDLIFCCNLLIYYQPAFQTMILNKFAKCLSQGGYLVTGETERPIALAHQYTEMYPQAAIFRSNTIRRKHP